jgi:hypothetical protein
MMHIQPTRLADRDRLRSLYLAAFSEDEREAVAELAVNLLAEETVPETFALSAELDTVPESGELTCVRSLMVPHLW